MAVSAVMVQNYIVTKVGDTADGILSANIAFLWDKYADKAQIAPRLQELYVTREAYELKIDKLQTLVDTSVELESVKFHQQIDTLNTRLVALQEEINKVESLARANRAPASGQLTNTEPIKPGDDPRTAFAPDPSGRQYRGDALIPARYRRSW